MATLAILLPLPWSALPPWLLVLAVLGRTLLQTGLFIVAHDAMHGTLWPERAKANRWMGQGALLLYAALPYGRCLANHHNHHRHAGTSLDPDHHGGVGGSFLSWYRRFMAAYLSPWQLTALVLIWGGIGVGAQAVFATPPINVLLFCTLPTLLSSLQLFLVGTFIPHGSAPAATSAQAHQPRSLELPPWLSLLSCYHFGYHREHHTFPHLPWHALPQARGKINDAFKSAAPFALL